MRRYVLAAVLLLVLLALTPASTRAAEPEPPPVPEGWLGLPRIDPQGRAPFVPDVLFERYLWRADATPPKAGEKLRGVSGEEATWAPLVANEKRALPGGGLALAYATVEAPRDGVWPAKIVGASVVYVNGTPVGGDVYGHGITELPVALRKGTNHLYAAGFRGAFSVAFDFPSSREFVGRWDTTLPDVVPGGLLDATAGVLIVNPSEQESVLEVKGTILVSDGSPEGTRFHLRPRGEVVLPPLGAQKVCLQGAGERIPEGTKQGWLAVTVYENGRVLENHGWELAVRAPGEPYRVTFRSDIDGSAQFYALRAPGGEPKTPPLPVLTLHGAGVDALAQAKAYSARPGTWIIAPTNRRPFGFDWQDWGRQDAYEVMAHVQQRHGLPERFHLTGHSMGGHGAWHLAVNDPDRFLSVAPSAGWCSFDTYGGPRPQGVLQKLWHAADAASETDRWLGNLEEMPIYVLHGTKDDNVPPREAKDLVRKLEGTAKRLEVHYAEGKGHWWDGDAAEGVDCVDWPGIFAMFQKVANGASPLRFWTTADLSVDADHGVLRIEQPLRYGHPSSLRAGLNAESGLFEVETDNVRRLVVTALPQEPASGPRTISLDGQVFTIPDAAREDERSVAFRRSPSRGAWALAGDLPADEKRPERMGPFKRAFDHRFVLVYGTAGNASENAALLASARYDAEQWRYRANGRAECVTDRRFLANAEGYPDRNVILYGNATTNAAWNAVIPEHCPMRPERGKVRAGAKTWEGDAYGILFVYPRKGSDVAQAAVVADTGVPGTRLNFRLPYFRSGVGIPDFVVYGPEVLRRGDEGVRAAGFFDTTWNLAE